MSASYPIQANSRLVLICALLVSTAPASALGETIFEDSFEHICPPYYEDADLDTYGNDATATQYCENPPPD